MLAVTSAINALQKYYKRNTCTRVPAMETVSPSRTNAPEESASSGEELFWFLFMLLNGDQGSSKVVNAGLSSPRFFSKNSSLATASPIFNVGVSSEPAL